MEFWSFLQNRGVVEEEIKKNAAGQGKLLNSANANRKQVWTRGVKHHFLESHSPAEFRLNPN